MLEDIILIGPPGSGKGTVGRLLAMSGIVHHVSTGDLVRDFLATLAEDDPINIRIMTQGEFLNDEEISALLVRALDGHRHERVVFDGYPRNLPQIEMLDRILAGMGHNIGHVISLDVPDEIIIDRISGRHSCRVCNRVFHVRNNPPPEEGCCGSTAYLWRVDDTAEIVEMRLLRYHEYTAKLTDVYETRGLVRHVDGTGTIEEVMNKVVGAMKL